MELKSNKNYFGTKYLPNDSRPFKIDVERKTCSKCKAEKEVAEFTKRAESQDGYNTQCRSCLCKSQAKIRAEKKLYEIHFNGQKISNSDLEELKTLSKKIPEECVIYEILQSKMNFKELPKEKPKPESKPKIYNPILTYKEVSRASYAVSNKTSKTMIAKALYCSVQKVNRSLIWFEATGSEKEYNSYDPTKLNLAVSK